MTAFDAPHTNEAPADAARLISAIGLALALAYAVFLLGAWAQGYWLIDATGRNIANDFINIYAAGKQALAGHAAAAYDLAAQRQTELAAAGHPFEGFYPWPYPPPLLFPAVALAMLPTVPAALVWLVTTGAGYVAAMRAILGPRTGTLLALGFPAALWNVTAGQNGFLFTALIGGALALMERSPILAGFCIGALACKPQLAMLFPVVLAVCGRWRVLGAAVGAAAVLAAASSAAFGTASWIAFVDALPSSSMITFDAGGAGFGKLQSAFGLARSLGTGAARAWALQGALVAIAVAALVALWRSRVAFDLKAAALGTGCLLATPYLFIYDLVMLAIPVAFLLRYSLAHAFSVPEIVGLVAACVLLLGYILLPLPVGFLAALIVAALVARRIIHGRD